MLYVPIQYLMVNQSLFSYSMGKESYYKLFVCFHKKPITRNILRIILEFEKKVNKRSTRKL